MAGYGMKSHVLYQFQNSFGTPLTNSMMALPVTKSNLVYAIEQLTEETKYGMFDTGQTHHGKRTCEGDMEFEVTPHALGVFLKSVIGLTDSTSATGVINHEFKLAQTDWDDWAACQPITFEQNLDIGSAGLFTSMVGNTLNLNGANGELLKGSIGFIGGGFTKKAAGSPVYTMVPAFKWDQSSFQWGGIPVYDFVDFNLSINNNLEATYTMINTAFPQYIKRSAQRALEFNGTMVFNSHSYWQAWENGIQLPVVLNFAMTGTPYALKIDMPSVRLKTFEPTAADAGLHKIPFTAEPKYWQASACAIHITLTNTRASY